MVLVNPDPDEDDGADADADDEGSVDLADAVNGADLVRVVEAARSPISLNGDLIGDNFVDVADADAAENCSDASDDNGGGNCVAIDPSTCPSRAVWDTLL